MRNCKDSTEYWCATLMTPQIGTLTPRYKSPILSNQGLRIAHKLHWGIELAAQRSTSQLQSVKSAFSPVAWLSYGYANVPGEVCASGGSHTVKKGNSSENAQRRERNHD